jgi:iron complex transport system permease protein
VLSSSSEQAEAIVPGNRAQRRLLFLWGGLLVVFFAGVGIGPVPIAPSTVMEVLLDAINIPRTGDFSSQEAAILLNIRMPRVILGILVGAALGMGGAALQGLFRNPLADPGLLGVSSGGALGAVVVIVLGTSWVGGLGPVLGIFILPFSAFAGALAAACIIYAIASGQGRSDRATMLLAGIAVNAAAGSGTGLLVYLSDSEELKSLTFWIMGSLGGACWQTVLVMALFVLLPLLVLPRLARALNAVLMGDDVAVHLGFDPVWINRWTVLLVTATVGAAVAVSGVIGFVGLIAPHVVRLLGGADHRFVLPASALAGAILLSIGDLFARTAVSPADLPIGIVMGSIGGPFFIWLLMRRIRREG